MGPAPPNFVLQSDASPAGSLSSLFLALASSALVHLGEAPHPETGKLAPDLGSARQSIDLLGLLQTKTEGNRTPEETQLLASLLTDLRVRFVARSKPQ